MLDMHIVTDAILLHIAPFMENKLIIRCLGSKSGVIKGVVSTNKSQYIFSPGEFVHLTYKARLNSHLGMMQIERLRNFQSLLLFSRIKVLLLQSVLDILNAVLADGEVDGDIYNLLMVLLECFVRNDELDCVVQYSIFELNVLKRLGYGLALDACVVTASQDDLRYISPKSGCAVSGLAGKEYHNLLFQMPKFYCAEFVDSDCIEVADAVNALNINEFFLQKRVFECNNSDISKSRKMLGYNVLRLLGE